jgi:hypothetical protein
MGWRRRIGELAINVAGAGRMGLAINVAVAVVMSGPP